MLTCANCGEPKGAGNAGVYYCARCGRETPHQTGSAHEHAGIPPRRPFKPDAIRVDRGDYTRASGMCICEVCGVCYFDHATVQGFTWLNRLCDGRLVKL